MSKKRAKKQKYPFITLDGLEKSTQFNRNLGKGLIVLLLPVLASTAQITDLQLVENHSTIDLPIMDLALPFSLMNFGYCAPVAILVAHVIFLISLHEHALKLNT